MKLEFYKLAVGARFQWRGKRFKKLGMSCAEDEGRRANVFLGLMEVEPEGEPPLLSPAEAARWKPPYDVWTEVVEKICREEAG